MERVVSSVEIEKLARNGQGSPIGLYCMGSLVANQAARDGHVGLAKSIEGALEGFLASMTRDQQFQALRLSYEIALEGDEPVPPRLRLVYSRD
jgi:hypothetical protein